MANTYNWEINAMDRYPTQDSLTGVVHTIHWRMYATSDQAGEDGDPYTANVFGTYNLAEPDTENYIEYANLTQSIVEGWLDSNLDVAQIQSGLDDQINQLITPSNLTEAPPWTNPN
tara:strand:+ start:380 stop:727 length:348 start_codon:yes stop_codon:yes gene_type:complete